MWGPGLPPSGRAPLDPQVQHAAEGSGQALSPAAGSFQTCSTAGRVSVLLSLSSDDAPGLDLPACPRLPGGGSGDRQATGRRQAGAGGVGVGDTAAEFPDCPCLAIIHQQDWGPESARGSPQESTHTSWRCMSRWDILRNPPLREAGRQAP